MVCLYNEINRNMIALFFQLLLAIKIDFNINFGFINWCFQMTTMTCQYLKEFVLYFQMRVAYYRFGNQVVIDLASVLWKAVFVAEHLILLQEYLQKKIFVVSGLYTNSVLFEVGGIDCDVCIDSDLLSNGRVFGLFDSCCGGLLSLNT